MKFVRVFSSCDIINSWNITPVIGLTTTHAMVPSGGHLYMRETSCFSECCYSNMIFHKIFIVDDTTTTDDTAIADDAKTTDDTSIADNATTTDDTAIADDTTTTDDATAAYVT
ncbi:hypothetical protein LSAT2_007132, partial [Lamellibrachia satsuma]